MSGEPKRIMLAIPCHDARVDVATVAGLLQVCAAGGGSVQPFLSAGDSNIAHHRNSIAHALKTRPEYKDCDTLVWVDSDIGFTVQDFLYVMEPNADGTHPDLVIAPYSEKNESGRSIEWGMGFVRTSRELFEKLDAWMVEEQEALNRYYLNGELATHYFQRRHAQHALARRGLGIFLLVLAPRWNQDAARNAHALDALGEEGLHLSAAGDRRPGRRGAIMQSTISATGTKAAALAVLAEPSSQADENARNCENAIRRALEHYIVVAGESAQSVSVTLSASVALT